MRSGRQIANLAIWKQVFAGAGGGEIAEVNCFS